MRGKKRINREIIVKIDDNYHDTDHVKVDIRNLSFREFRFFTYALREYTKSWGIDSQDDDCGIFIANVARDFEIVIDRIWLEFLGKEVDNNG